MYRIDEFESRMRREELLREAEKERLVRRLRAERVGEAQNRSGLPGEAPGYFHGLVRSALRANKPGGDCAGH